MSKRFLSITLAAFALCCFASSCVKESGFEERVKDIAKTDSLTSRIATVEEQTAQLTSSVTTLTEEHNKLQKFTGELSAKVAEMEKELATVDERIAAVKTELKDSLDKQKTALIGMLEDYKEEMQTTISELNGQIQDLQEEDTELLQKINDLRKYVDDTLKGTRDWARATFATLAQKDSLAGVTAAIDVYAKAVNYKVDSLAKVHSEDTATIFAAIRALDSKSSKALADAVQKLNGTIEKTAATIKTEYTAAISQAIEASEASIKGWVNDTLNAYYTAAKVDAKVKVAMDEIDSLSKKTLAAEARIAALEAAVPAIAPTLKNLSDSLNTAYSNIQKVRDSLHTLDNKIDTTRTAITAAYRSAIKDSLDTLRLVMNKSFKAVNDSVSALAGRMSAVEGRVSALETNMATVRDSVQKLQAEIAGLRTDIDKLIARIQAIEVIPQYQDGSVAIKNSSAVDISFEVRPASLTKAIVDAKGTAAFHLQAVETKAATKAVTYVNLGVNSVTFSGTDSLLVLTVNKGSLPDAFFSEDKFFNACLRISDGNTDKTSAFFPLTPLVETANCYIVTKAGTYKFKAVKGNSDESVGDVKGVKVLWESYGTSTPPTSGAIISAVSYSNGKITYTATDKKGNAVIAAYSDADCTDGNVLWSWHIWCTEQPTDQVYNGTPSAGTMMDRNLGATSAIPGEVGALGLLYQWGRKDPFLGADSISYKVIANMKQAASTLEWPAPVAAQDNSSDATLNLKTSIKKPTTFIKNVNDDDDPDWYCINSQYRSDSLWNVTSGKTIYDPCPVGYRVPNGGASGVWRVAFGKDSPSNTWDDINKGFDFGTGTDQLVSSGTCWYPAAGYRGSYGGSLLYVGCYGYFCSCTPLGINAYIFYITDTGFVRTMLANCRAYGQSVRCVKE